MVSVIMPTYNRAHLVKATIDSVLGQTYRDLELIIIDDGSDDGTEEIIRSYTDQRIIYVKREHSGYIGRLRNAGLNLASGEYIALLDSDDQWIPNKLEQQLRLMSLYPGAGFCISDVKITSQGELIKEHSYPVAGGIEITNIFRRLAENHFWVYPSTKLFKRSCLEKTGLFHENIRSSDFNFTFRLAYYFDAVVQYAPLVTRLVHPSNRSTLFSIQNYSDYVTTFEFMFRNNMINKEDLDYAKWNAHFRRGLLYQDNGQSTAARRSYRAALRMRPFHLRSYKHLLSSYIKS